jgi:hypothetical protein
MTKNQLRGMNVAQGRELAYHVYISALEVGGGSFFLGGIVIFPSIRPQYQISAIETEQHGQYTSLPLQYHTEMFHATKSPYASHLFIHPFYTNLCFFFVSGYFAFIRV